MDDIDASLACCYERILLVGNQHGNLNAHSPKAQLILLSWVVFAIMRVKSISHLNPIEAIIVYVEGNPTHSAT